MADGGAGLAAEGPEDGEEERAKKEAAYIHGAGLLTKTPSPAETYRTPSVTRAGGSPRPPFFTAHAHTRRQAVPSQTAAAGGKFRGQISAAESDYPANQINQTGSVSYDTSGEYP